MKIIKKSVDIGGRTLSLEYGRFAQQATSAVLARYGDTMVIATVVASSKETNLDYFPLSVEYVERLYAGGRIKGSRWVKREGRPTDDAILRARLIDRSIRPLFDTNFRHDIQVIVTVLSVDGENEPDILGIVAVSAALAISPIPWNGPIGSVRVGYVPSTEGETGFFVNPGEKEVAISELDLVVSGTEEKTLMLELGANQVKEEVFYEALKFAKPGIGKIIKIINELVKEVGKEKIKVGDNKEFAEVKKLFAKEFKSEIEDLVIAKAKKEEGNEMAVLTEAIANKYVDKYDKKTIDKAIDKLFKEQIRKNVLEKDKRADGRKPDEVREIGSEVSLLPRTHGSAMFRRGSTQVLSIATLGSPSMEQLIESPEGETSKRYMHHYSMPPYSVGETGRVGFPSRREIGHGALAERALLPVIPPQATFPYTIRIVSEVMSSNGSTSMASTCGSTLSLMDAGVPIKSPVSGIAMGLMSDGSKNVILTDIIGLEDFCGDMDFKVAGTEDGITAIQLDVKNDGLSEALIKEIIIKGRIGMKFILGKMLETLDKPRDTLSKYAPRVSMITVPKEKIGEIIGPGGKVIRSIIAETGCDINVNDEGVVTIAGTEPDKVEIAYKWISGIIKDVMPGEVYEGIVKRILSFGAFVEILPGKEGMVHVSQMAVDFVADPNTIVQVGQKVTVRVTEIDDQGRINLSMLFGEDANKKSPPRPQRRDGGGRGGFSRGRRF